MLKKIVQTGDSAASFAGSIMTPAIASMIANAAIILPFLLAFSRPLTYPRASSRYDNPTNKNPNPMREIRPEMDFSSVEEKEMRASPVPRD